MKLAKNPVRAPWFVLLLATPLFAVSCSDAPLSMGNAGGSGGQGTAGSGGGDTCATSECGPQLGIANFTCSDGSIGGPTGRCLRSSAGVCGWEIRQCPPPGSGGAAGASGAAGAGNAAGSGGGSMCNTGADCAVPAVCKICADGSASCAGGACVNGQCVTTFPPCGTGGSGGAAGSGGTGGATCGKNVCQPGQYCCGPVECGICVPENSGIACIASCGGSGGAAGSGGSGGADCSAMLDDVTRKLAAAQVCNKLSASPVAQCQGVVDGLCCQELVQQAGSTQTMAYLSALQNYKASCGYACPAIACRIPQPGNCVQASGASNGMCQ